MGRFPRPVDTRGRQGLASFASGRDGAIAVMSAYVIPLLVVLVFSLMNVSRALSIKEKLQAGLDAATLLAARSTTQTNAARRPRSMCPF